MPTVIFFSPQTQRCLLGFKGDELKGASWASRGTTPDKDDRPIVYTTVSGRIKLAGPNSKRIVHNWILEKMSMCLRPGG